MVTNLNTPDSLPDGVWRGLLKHAYSLVDEITTHGIQNPLGTFGGGTVLMLRYRHRLSKDIDIFVPDPQYLGFVSPRLGYVHTISILQDACDQFKMGSLGAYRDQYLSALRSADRGDVGSLLKFARA